MSADRIDVRAVIAEAIEYLSPEVDVVDGDYGQPCANPAMALTTELKAAQAAVDELLAALAAFDGMGRDSIPGTPNNLRRLREAFARCGGGQ